MASEIVIEFHQSKRKCLMLRTFKRLIQDETLFAATKFGNCFLLS